VSSVFVDSLENLYFADFYNKMIRKISTDGIIHTIVGTGIEGGGGGDGGLAINAQLNYPSSIAFDKYGNLYITEEYKGNRIRKVNTDGIITTIAGTGVAGYSGDGDSAIFAKISNPRNIVIDDSGNIYFSEYYSYRIRKINTEGIITTVAGTGIDGYNGDDIPATSAMLNYPEGLAIDKDGNLTIADRNNGRIRKVDKNGFIKTIAGGGAVGTSDYIGRPYGLAFDTKGNLYFTNFSANMGICKIDYKTGVVNKIIERTYNLRYSGEGELATLARIGYSPGIYVTPKGNIYLSMDTNFNRICKLDYSYNYWLGTENDVWENQSNWSLGYVPSEENHVVIDNAAAPFSPVLRSDVTVLSLELYNGANLTVNTGNYLNIIGP
jgi:streptogramin lyase